MPPHSNFVFRDPHEAETAHIAVAAVLKALLEKTDVDVDRIRQFVGAACNDDMTLIARAMWHVQWMTGLYDAEGERR